MTLSKLHRLSRSEVPHLKLVRGQLAETEGALARERARAAQLSSRHDGLVSSAHALIDARLFPELATALQPRRAPALPPPPGGSGAAHHACGPGARAGGEGASQWVEGMGTGSQGAGTPQLTPWGTPIGSSAYYGGHTPRDQTPLWEEASPGGTGGYGEPPPMPLPMPMMQAMAPPPPPSGRAQQPPPGGANWMSRGGAGVSGCGGLHGYQSARGELAAAAAAQRHHAQLARKTRSESSRW